MLCLTKSTVDIKHVCIKSEEQPMMPGQISGFIKMCVQLGGIAMLVLLVLFGVTKLTRAQWVLVWSDEFDGTHLKNSEWSFDIGTGQNGWGK